MKKQQIIKNKSCMDPFGDVRLKDQLYWKQSLIQNKDTIRYPVNSRDYSSSFQKVSASWMILNLPESTSFS